MKKILFFIFILAVTICSAQTGGKQKTAPRSAPAAKSAPRATQSAPAKTNNAAAKAQTNKTPAAKPQVGLASYYAHHSKGRMANGQRHHRDSMFCAHRTHPFGTLLKVTNLRNNKMVIVKVTDRGPYGRGRVIDVSYGAAQALGFVAAGVTRVKVEVFDGRLNSEIAEHDTDSTDLLLDYQNPEQFDLPYRPGKDDSEQK